jgi:hypothetical protein
MEMITFGWALLHGSYTRATAGVLVALLLLAPVTSRAEIRIQRDNDTFDIPEPAEDEQGNRIWSDGAYYMGIYQIEKGFDAQWWMQTSKISARDEAENVTPFDEVMDSTWYTHRHEVFPMSVEDLVLGAGPPIKHTGTWTIVKGKGVGINPGFLARDPEGNLLFVKFDPKDFPGMGSNGDVIASRFHHAAGYNVPVTSMVTIDPSRLVVAPDATIEGKYRKERPMTDEDLETILSKAPTTEDGKFFADVSLGIQGKPIGPVKYNGVRKDDPNDTVLHENRRELRGLRVMMSWVNDTDARRGNTLDVYVEEDGARFVKHYLLDFSASLGSYNLTAKPSWSGHEYIIDLGQIFRRFFTLGLMRDRYEEIGGPVYPEIGYFESKNLDPGTWRTDYTNPAFERMTVRDAFWGARLVAAFTDEEIRAVVDLGYFPTPGAKEHTVQILIERRDKIAKFWFDLEKINPLDRFELVSDASGSPQITFRDVAVARRYAEASTTLYRYGSEEAFEQTSDPSIPAPASAAALDIHTSRDGGATWGMPLTVNLVRDGSRIALAGIQR